MELCPSSGAADASLPRRSVPHITADISDSTARLRRPFPRTPAAALTYCRARLGRFGERWPSRLVAETAEDRSHPVPELSWASTFSGSPNNHVQLFVNGMAARGKRTDLALRAGAQ
jgi:hypothetical protein